MIKLFGMLIQAILIIVVVFSLGLFFGASEDEELADDLWNIAAQLTDFIAPTYDSAKADCDELALENQDDLNLVSLESEDYGSRSGKRFVVYQANILFAQRERLCVHFGDRVMFPPFLQQATFLN